MVSIWKVFIPTVVVFLFCASAANAQVPTITSFTPASGPVGTTITVTGSNFTCV